MKLGLGEFLRDGAKSRAEWELKMSKNIFSSKKRLAFLFILTIPILLIFVAQASGALTLPATVGGKESFIPSFINPTMFYGSIFVGIIAGLITGVIGAGGGYVLTPALMSFGVKGIMAVGTDQFHLFTKAIMGTTIHRKLGNVNFGLAAWFVVGSFVGITAGGSINRALFQSSPALSDVVISSVYVIVLGILGIYSISDWIRQGKRKKLEGPGVSDNNSISKFAGMMQRLPIPPYIKFDKDIVEGGRKISFLPLVLVGLLVGFISSIMGVGGGFVTFPIFVYGLGISTFTTVGTDILQIIFSMFYSSVFQYAIYGFVFYTVAIGMLLGSLVGVQIGALVTKVAKGSQIRAFFALTILAGFANRLFSLPKKLTDLGYMSIDKNVNTWIENIGNVIFFGIIGIFALWIIKEFIQNIGVLRENIPGNEHALLVKPKKFFMGITGLVLFAVVFVIGMMPIYNGQNALASFDQVFNSVAKDSISVQNFSDVKNSISDFDGTDVNISFAAKEAEEKAIENVVSKNGMKYEELQDGRIRIIGNLGSMSSAAFADATSLYNNDSATLTTKYGTDPKETMYSWWLVYDGIAKRYTQQDEGANAAFTKSMELKVIEPAYNFSGIEPKSVQKDPLPIVLLLLFYLIYTLWYGFSIMFIFEGFGITATASKHKEE
jgi:uncharacterized membrane protein YfcA